MFLLCDEISGQVSFSGTTFANQTSSLKIRMNFNVERKVFLKLLLVFFNLQQTTTTKLKTSTTTNKSQSGELIKMAIKVHFDLKFVSINYQTL